MRKAWKSWCFYTRSDYWAIPALQGRPNCSSALVSWTTNMTYKHMDAHTEEQADVKYEIVI